jgi:hypothetical protein
MYCPNEDETLNRIPPHYPIDEWHKLTELTSWAALAGRRKGNRSLTEARAKLAIEPICSSKALAGVRHGNRGNIGQCLEAGEQILLTAWF